MIKAVYLGIEVRIPENWLEVSYLDAQAIQVFTVDNMILHYCNFGEKVSIDTALHEQLSAIFAFVSDPMPDFNYRFPHLLNQSFWVWDGFRYSFEEGIKRATGHDVTKMCWPEAAPLVEYATKCITQIETRFAELKNDVRSDIARKSQPEGFWRGVEDWIDLKNMGMSMTENRDEFKKKVPLINYFQEQLFQHRATIAQNTANRIMNGQ